MKYTAATFMALCTIVCLTSAPRAQAETAHGIRADLQFPFGANELGNDWTLTASSAAGSPYNPGVSSSTSVALTFNTASGDAFFDFATGVNFSSGIQYDYYDAALPTGPFDPTAFYPGPAAQVLAFTVAAGQSVDSVALPTGAMELEFNYNTASNLVNGLTGPASFTMGGVTYTSNGPGAPTSTLNTFFFNPDGTLFGAETESAPGVFEVAVGAIAQAWSSSDGSTGTPVAGAPEIDPASATSALTLLGGVLLLLFGARRTPRRMASTAA